MTSSGKEEPVSSDFVRSYVITGGRQLPAADRLSLLTLVTIAPDRELPLGSGPEVRAIWELCLGGTCRWPRWPHTWNSPWASRGCC